MIETQYNDEDLPEWSDEKLAANIEAAERTCEAGTGDLDIDYWNDVFYSGLLQEEDRRKCDALAKIHAQEND
jgi:hypothetical protein